MDSSGHATRREWWLVALLLVIFLLKGLLWSLALPLWQGPDEEDHYNVIQFIGELGRLPDAADTFLLDEVALSRELADVGRLPYAPEQRQVFSDTAVGPGEPAFDTLPPETRTSFDLQMVGKLNKATPLYYLMAALPYRWSSSGNLLQRAQVQRLVALLAGSGIVIVAYVVALVLFPAQPAMRLTIPILVAFHPLLTQMTAVVSVDGFYFLAYSLLILFSILVLRDGLDFRYAVALALTFSAGFLTKPTINGFAPLIALLVLHDFWRAPERRRQVFWATALLGALIILLSGWWMLRSLRINNDLFYFNPVLEGHRIIQNPYFDYGVLAHALDYYRSVWGGIFVTWWAHFGWIDTPVQPWTYDVLRLLTFAAIAGLTLLLWRGRDNRPSAAAWRSGQRDAPLVVWLFLALAVLLPVLLLQGYDLLFWWEYGNGRGLQGRYWLGTVIPMLIFLTMGLLAFLPRRWQPYGHNALRLGMVLLNFAGLLGFVLPRYFL